MSSAGIRTISAAAASFALPAVFLRGILARRFGETISERCVGGAWRDFDWDERPVVWIHAASVGEVTGISPLVHAISELTPGCELLMTTTSVTGREEALRRKLADRALLFPLDHPVYVRRALDLCRPKLVILAETELWPNFLCELGRRNIPVVLVNGRISQYSFPRYRRLRWFFKPIVRTFGHISVQSAEDRERFLALGASRKKVTVAGSTKYAVQPASVPVEERAAFADLLGIDRQRPCFVAGSVRSGEDEQVIDAYLAALDSVPGLQMIIAPRHPERFLRVGELLVRKRVSFRRRSGLRSEGRADVVLLDSLGELTKAYAIGSFAFVGGSLVNIGGHNPFEPCLYRSPVIMGPHVANVQEAVQDLQRNGGLLQVQDRQELSAAIVRLATNSDECLLRGARGFEVWQQYSTAVTRIMPTIEPLLPRSNRAPVSAAVGVR